nr:signal peptidase I [Phaeacidiphilus oryzae]
MVIGTRSGGPDEPEGPEDVVGTGSGGSGGADGGSGGSGGSGGGPGGGSGRSGKASESDAARKPRSFWKELPILIVIAIALALVIKSFLVQAFSIPSGSMENTLQIGDRVLVDKLTPTFGAKPSRGEVVVFKDPGDWLAGEQTNQPSTNPVVHAIQTGLSTIGLMPDPSEKDLIKRVIAVGGDTVSCAKGGPVEVNGKPLTEPYIYPGATACDDHPFGPLKVPADHIWVMGDHRNDSLDSRYHMDEPGGGSVPDGNVIGRAFAVAWPLSHWKTLPIPSTFSQPGITRQAMGAMGSPAGLGLAGAVPLTWGYRQLRIRRERRRSRL